MKITYLKNWQKKINSSDDVFFVYFTCFLEICINLKVKLKSILNTTQKKKFSKTLFF